MCKKWLIVMISSLLLFGLNGAAWAAGEEQASVAAEQSLQMISEYKTITAGGIAKYHVIYHNVENIANTNMFIHVKIPEGFEMEDLGGGEWDATTRLLKWNVKEIKANGAHVTHFQLKMNQDAKVGERFELGAVAGTEGDVKWRAPNIAVTVGTETHQPFMQGYPDGTFQPDGLLTRAETAAMIARIRGLKTADGVQFKDVTSSHWAYRYIQQVSAEGMMIGYNGSFFPDQPITKAELLVIMLRLHGIHEVPLGSPFQDMSGHWSKDALGTAVALGYIMPAELEAGVNPLELLFFPDQPIERKIAAKWLDLGLLRGPLTDGEVEVVQHFPDVPRNHPYFHWIEEASSVSHESEHSRAGSEQLIRYLPGVTEPF